MEGRWTSLEESQGLPCGKVISVNLEPVHVSATAVRQAFASDQSVDDMVPKDVERFVNSRQLYVTEH